MIAGPPPRYGTCSMLTPVTLLNSSQYIWDALPMPADATLTLPGLLLAKAISSGTDLDGTDGCTTPGPRDIGATAAMSRAKWNLRLSYRVVFQASPDVARSSV